MSITLNDLSECVNALLKADSFVKQKEDELKIAKEKARVLREETLPGMMDELGFTSVKLEAGQSVTIRQNIHTQISKNMKPAMMDWLNKNGFGGLIKTQVQIQFGKGDHNAAKNLFWQLEQKYDSVGLSEDVHSQTLKAFLKEQLEKGNNIPLDIFGATPVLEAIIKN